MDRHVVVLTNDFKRNGVLPIIEELSRGQVETSVIDTSRNVSLTINDDGTARLEQSGDEPATITSETSVLSWRSSSPRPDSGSPSIYQVEDYVERVWHAAWTALHNIPARWVNPQSARRALEHDKSRQARAARSVGLETIPTLLTNEIDQFHSFISSFSGDVALKSPVGWHHRFSEGSHQDKIVATYTRRLTKSEALRYSSNVPAAPLFIQPYIEKQFELRITIIGCSIFSCRIDSQASERTAIDWRHYDFRKVSHTTYSLPSEMEEKLASLVAKLGLAYATIDMIADSSGKYWFVELNPSGHYGWIEALTGAPISRAIARYLAEPTDNVVLPSEYR